MWSLREGKYKRFHRLFRKGGYAALAGVVRNSVQIQYSRKKSQVDFTFRTTQRFASPIRTVR